MSQKSRRTQIVDRERHIAREQKRNEESLDHHAPNEPCTLQRIQNASEAHRGFIKWLGLSELAMGGLADLEITIGGFRIDRMGTEHNRDLRLMIWKLCVWNLNYYEPKAALYVILCDAEKTRAQHVRSQLQDFIDAQESN